MTRLLSFLLMAFAGTLTAQTPSGLIAYYPFNGDLSDVTGNSANTGVHSGNPSYLCGVQETALDFNGGTDRVNFLGPVLDEFNVEDFSLSFYMKTTGSAGTQYILSKRRTDCAGDFAFFIRYRPATRTLNVVLAETPNKTVSLLHQLETDKCWHFITLVRDENRVKLYVNGQLAQEAITVGRIDISNDGELILGSSDCLGPSETSFTGLIDDLRIYNRVLRPDEVRDLYARPDMIRTPDTLIFLGNGVDIELTSTCGGSFNWQPFDGVSSLSDPEPTITPTQPGATVYSVRIADDLGSCVALDSIRITVIDPADLDCGKIFLPNAFTPNDDGLNDTYGISNPYAVPELISFEIFDRWGGRVFFTEDAFGRWDGSFKGTAVNPGVLLYKVVYICREEEVVLTGSVTVLR